MKIQYKLIKNFLPKEKFKLLKECMIGNVNNKSNVDFPWYLNLTVSGKKEKDGIYFIHLFYHANQINSSFFNYLQPVLEIIKPKTILRIKGNLYPKLNKIVKHGNHVDYDYSHKGLIFYINSNNGYTILNNKIKIKSIENSALFFDPGITHCSTTCSDKDFRCNINFNYL
jgi:hypothetical protein